MENENRSCKTAFQIPASISENKFQLTMKEKLFKERLTNKKLDSPRKCHVGENPLLHCN